MYISHQLFLKNNEIKWCQKSVLRNIFYKERKYLWIPWTRVIAILFLCYKRMKCYFTNEIKYIFCTTTHQDAYISKYFAIFKAAEKWYFIDHEYSYESVRFYFFFFFKCSFSRDITILLNFIYSFNNFYNHFLIKIFLMGNFLIIFSYKWIIINYIIV